MAATSDFATALAQRTPAVTTPALAAAPPAAAESALAEAAAAGTLTGEAYREWLFPGADDLFRGIYTRACSGGRETLAICSAIAGEGKTTIALGLGVTIAEDHLDRRVLVVETDIRRPALADDFQFDRSPGLVDCLVDDVPLDRVCRPTFLDNLTIIPAGNAAPAHQVGRLLHSRHVVSLIERMRQAYDVVILDVPALLATSTAAGIANQADGVVFVVRAGITPAPLLAQAMKRIDSSKLRGVVLNEAHSRIPRWMRWLFGF